MARPIRSSHAGGLRRERASSPVRRLARVEFARVGRGARAGIVAAAVWAAVEPLAQRAFRTPYSDLRLLGGAVVTGQFWRPVGLAMHLVNGALFGAQLERRGWHGWKRGLAVAEIENVALWPGMALVDRLHPDRRSGAWPPLFRSGRVFAYEATLHALFGIVLGALLAREEWSSVSARAERAPR